MPDMIRDGTGKGYLVAVDKENHLHTMATTESLIAHRSHYNSTAFGGSTPLLTLTTTGGRMLYIRNDSTSHDFCISDMWFSWNGGSTNRNTCMEGTLFFGDTAPSANNTASAVGVLNRKSSHTADVTISYWTRN